MTNRCVLCKARPRRKRWFGPKRGWVETLHCEDCWEEGSRPKGEKVGWLSRIIGWFR